MLSLDTAVKDEFSHNIGLFLHSEGIVDSLRSRSKVKALPGISLIGTAVLLDHTLDEAVNGGRNIVFQPVDAVLIERNDVVVNLNSVVELTD